MVGDWRRQTALQLAVSVHVLKQRVSLKAYKTIIRTHKCSRELRPLKIDSGSDESILAPRNLFQRKRIFGTKVGD